MSGDARSAAVALLKRKARSRRELIDSLVAKGFPEQAAALAADQLEGARALSDRALAQSIVASARRRGMSDAAIAERLRSRGIDEQIADAALQQSTEGPSDPFELARRRVAAAPKSGGRAAAARRAMAFLARRGYDEDTARDAVERAIDERFGPQGP